MAAVGTALAVLLTGCAGQGGAEQTATPTTTPATSSGPSSGPSETSSAAPSATSSAPSGAPSDTSAAPTPSPTSEPSPEPSEPAGDRKTLSGTVRAGVEAGCLVLRDSGTLYLLLDDQDRIKPGDKVTVTGYVDEDVMSYCMQGTPFRVEKVSKP